eukprot:gene15695-23959_t
METGDVFLSPHAAGHLLGACLWHIVRDADEVAYAPYFNHKPERHLPPADIQCMQKATVMATLRKDGNVLIPVDTAGRVLELLLLLEDHWRDTYGESGAPYTLLVLGEYGECTIAMAEQSLEFMSDAVKHAFESRGTNPLSFMARGIVKFCRTRAEMDDITGPVVALAGPTSMNVGCSLDVLMDWGEDKRNTVILIEEGGPGSVARKLLEFVTDPTRSALDPFFLEAHQEIPLSADE